MPPSSPTQDRATTLALIMVLAVVAVLGAPHVIAAVVDTDYIGDFLAYYFAAYCVSRGASPYLTATQDARWELLWSELNDRHPELARYEGRRGPQYLYPPALAIVMVPLTHWDLFTAKRLWSWLSLGMLVLSAVLLGLMMPRSKVVITLGLIAILFTTRTVRRELTLGQADILTLTLTCGALWLYLRKRPAASALLLAGAVFIKVTPLFIIFYYIVKRKWRYLLWLLAGLVALGMLSAVVVGWSTSVSYITEVIPTLDVCYPSNQTLNSFFLQLFMRLHDHWPIIPRWPGDILSWLSRIGLLAGCLWVLHRSVGGHKQETAATTVQAWAMLAMVGLVCGGSAWTFVYLWAILPLAALLMGGGPPAEKWQFWAIVGLAFVVTQYQPPVYAQYWRQIVVYLCLIAGIVLILALAWVLLKSRPKTQGQVPD